MTVSDVHEVASATLYGDATAHLMLDGAMHSIRGDSDADARQQVLHLVAAKARQQNAAVLLATRDRFGSGHLRVRPGGVVEAVGAFVPAGPDDVLRPLVDTADLTELVAPRADSPKSDAAGSTDFADSAASTDFSDSTVVARGPDPDPASEAAALEALYRAAASESPGHHDVEHPDAAAQADAKPDVAAPSDVAPPAPQQPEPTQAPGTPAGSTPEEAELAPETRAPARASRAKSRSRRVSVPSVPDSAGPVGPAESLWPVAPAVVAETVPTVLPEPAPLPTPVRPVPPPERREPAEEERADAVRTSFLAPERERRSATRGWRGALARTGLPVAPNRFERGERSDVEVVRRTWTVPRTIAVVNGKGGANKTPTTALLAAVFARLGGAGVLAWDNNDARGTLGWRTDSAGHELSAGEVLAQAQWLLSPDAGAADLAGHVHHQAVDKYDVLRASPLQITGEHRIDEREFDALHAVASKYYRLVIVDSGNDESSPRWRRMIDRTDQLVVATTALGEHAEAGALLLEALSHRDERSSQLAERAVVVVSQSEKSAGQVAAKRIAEAFAPMVRQTVTIPYDRALHSGKIRYDALEPDTRRAWLTAAAAAAEGL
ncbi:ATPase [uncultured Amnibacterium sp.]|uniref:ATPase n=1 Tax=uncultured Amnibacterium sp. TaxID=1631851 RepID=UPI0035CA0F30